MMSDSLVPNLTINDTSVRVERQQAVLRPSKLAYEIRFKQKNHPPTPVTNSQKLLWKEETALEEAKRLAKSLGSVRLHEKEYLGQLVLTFGKYVNCTFKWLLENDVGYVKYLLDHHAKEKKKHSSVRDVWLKDYLHRYVSFFHQVSSHLEENVDHCIYGITPYKDYTFEEMFNYYHKFKTNQKFESSDEKVIGKKVYDQVRRWLCLHPDQISTNAMKRFQLYIKEKEKVPISSSDISCSIGSPSSSKFSPSKFDTTWTDDSSLFEAMVIETQQQPVVLHKSKAHIPATVSKASTDLSAVRQVTNVQHSNPKPSCDSKPKDTSLVIYEGWHKTWQEDGFNSIPKEDWYWLRESEYGMFQPTQTFKDNQGNLRLRKVLKTDRMWFYPPDPPGMIKTSAPKPDAFFHNRVFFWRPVGVWGYQLHCPRPDCPDREKTGGVLYRNGYHTRARQICDLSDWYTILSEVLSCSACNKAGIYTKYIAWDQTIISQLSEAHQALFPAILTARRGVDKKVIRLMMDRSVGNTISRIWHQVLESHSLQYLERKDLYTTLLNSLTRKGCIVESFNISSFKTPPKRREPPSSKLFQSAYLLAEAEKVEDYRNQIMSTFGKILKFDSTKKICKKISGVGRGTAEWCTNIGNENSQVLSFVLTCEESTEKLKPMAEGLMDRYKRAGEDPPLVMYVDKGCCRKFGPSAVEKLFHFWVDEGMNIRLDAWHWMHRFDAAVRTDAHPKYSVFKSALSGAVFAYNRADLDLLIKALKAGDKSLTDLPESEIISSQISRKQLQHHVRRITVGVQTTLDLVNSAIEELKTEAGLDVNGIPLFKSAEAIDEVWRNQQKHLECLQDPAGLSFYTVIRKVNLNGVELPYYKCSRGNNSLEGFHAHFKNMVPGDHCALQSLQIYMLSGVARWNSDREFEAVQSGCGRKHRAYSTQLIHRLNTRCQALFGPEEIEEINFRPPVPPGSELLGVEYLLRQSEPSFQVNDHYATIKDKLLVETPEEEEPTEENVAEESLIDPGYESDDETIVMNKSKTFPVTDLDTAPELDPAIEDVCGNNHIPGFDKVEALSLLLVSLAEEDGKLSIDHIKQKQIVKAFNELEEYDKNPKKFHLEYSSRWGNTLYKRCSGEPEDAAVTQKVKFGIRYSPAHHIDSSNRLVYCVIKQLWLKLNKGNQSSTSVKNRITSHYQRMQHRVMVEDATLSRLFMPLPKINSKSVSEFIRRQEALISLKSTKQSTSIIRKEGHITEFDMPSALKLPKRLPITDRPEVPFVEKECFAGYRKIKKRAAVQHHKSTSSFSTSQPSSISSTISNIVPNTAKSESQQLTMPQYSSHSISRSTFYKHLKRERDQEEEKSVKRKPSIPICSQCNKPIQGHQKYKKKTWCEETKRSTSKGLTKKEFKDYDHFKEFIDSSE